MRNNFYTFRDPSGTVFFDGGNVYRAIYAEGIEDYWTFCASKAYAQLVEAGSIVSARKALPDKSPSFELSNFAEEPIEFAVHERIEFPSYPYEWSPGMLKQAGFLTLDIAETLLNEGFGLKDASPLNILFRWSKPIFVDFLSIERRSLTDALWLAKAQFDRTFILPLIASKHFGLGLGQIFIPYRDGLKPAWVRQRCGFGKALSRDFFFPVTLPALLDKKSETHIVDQIIHEDNAQRKERFARLYRPDVSKFIMQKTFGDLRNQLQRLSADGKRRDSNWTEYEDTLGYGLQQVESKKKFVQRVLDKSLPKRILDVGCNTGLYSELCARSGSKVVAIDGDVAVVDRLNQTALTKGLDILSLNINFARPSPAIGWENGENLSFIERAEGFFDGVLLLAVIHHLILTERIPLRAILALCGRITKNFLIIEFIGNRDPMFRLLSRHNEHLYANFNRQFFEEECLKQFNILQCEEIVGTDRCLYHLEKRHELV